MPTGAYTDDWAEIEMACRNARDVYDSVNRLHNLVRERYEANSRVLPSVLAEEHSEYAASWIAFRAAHRAVTEIERAADAAGRSTRRQPE